MKSLKIAFNFYINSSIHVALAVYCLVLITEKYYNIPYNKPLNYFIFFGSVFGYNFVKYINFIGLGNQKLTKNLQIIQAFSLSCFLLMLYFASKISIRILFWALPFSLLTLLYAIPFLGKLPKNLRNIPSIKIVIIALVWAGVTVLLPVFNADIAINSKVVLTFLQRFLFVIVLTLPFDIRDFRFDKRQLQTIPQLIGVKRTKKFGFILLLITLVIEFFITPNTNFKTVFLLVFVLLLVLLQRASIKQKKYYASFWVEAIPIFWAVLLLMFT